MIRVYLSKNVLSKCSIFNQTNANLNVELFKIREFVIYIPGKIPTSFNKIVPLN